MCGGMIPRQHRNAAEGGNFDFHGKLSAGGFIPAHKLAHVAPGNAETCSEVGLPDAGFVEERSERVHALQVGTERTFPQEEVRSVRLGNVRARWHHANMGLKIRDLRKKRGLTGEQLAEMVGVTKGYISELENDKKTPGAGLVLRLADALRVEVFELYEGTLAEQKAGALRAHMEVMSQLEDADRAAIEKAALGLLAKQS